MKKAYRIVLIPEDSGYAVYVPAFDGWTQGEDIADALCMATDYIELMGVTLEDGGQVIPEDVPYQAKDGEIESYVCADFAAYRRKLDNRKVKKTLTIKSWLNDAAEREGINFSRTLEEALMKELHLEKPDYENV